MKVLILITSMTIALAGCMQDDPNRRAKIGATVGVLAGALLGHKMDDGAGKWVGAAVGALAGGGVGHYMDSQQRDFEQALDEERQAHELEIERLHDETLKLTLDSEVSFDINKADIKYGFQPSLQKLSDVLMRYDRTVVHVVGHTDSTGDAGYNQRLSEQRAERVGRFLASRGVPDQRVRSEGRGEREPRDSNANAAGRQLNRRVEVFVKPIIAGNESYAYASPRYTLAPAVR